LKPLDELAEKSDLEDKKNASLENNRLDIKSANTEKRKLNLKEIYSFYCKQTYIPPK